METGEVLFEQNRRQREQIKILVNLLGDLIDTWESGDDCDTVVREAKKFLLIDTSLGINYLNTRMKNRKRE